jgi:hypothetical protein
MKRPPPERLSEEDRRVIADTLEEISSTTPPTDLGYLGCPVAILGVVLLLGWPQVLGLVPWAAFFSPFVMLGAVLFIIGGPIAGLRSGGFTRGASLAASEAAVRQLERGDGGRDVMLRAATLLISHAFVSHGPTASMAFDPSEVVNRIGSALPLVLGVEMKLLEDSGGYPVFSDGPEEPV